jgi:hypothetical protein
MAKTFTFFAEDEKIEVRIVEVTNNIGGAETNVVWLDSTITVEAGAFLGSFKAAFTTIDLEELRQQLTSVLRASAGTIRFRNSGKGLELTILLNADGKASITGVAQPKRLQHGILHFAVQTSRMALFRSLRELEGIVRSFSTESAIHSAEAASQ